MRRQLIFSSQQTNRFAFFDRTPGKGAVMSMDFAWPYGFSHYISSSGPALCLKTEEHV